MKTKWLFVALVIALMTMGFECINDPIIVSLNMTPISKCFPINPGANPGYSDSYIFDPSTLIDDSYKDKLVNARVYDITVQVGGAFGGSVTNGHAYINGHLLFDYDGTWATFSTPQTLLGGSTHVRPQLAGILELVNVLKQSPLQPVTLSSSGTLTGGGVPPVPAGLSVCINVYAQVDANASGSSNE